ncbi:MAG: hypothetical protein M1828_002462 [Chrysothrix sp. TS-e1954]|nr:MAG: hypothetical protein M1828_002462 [Chrysothrix sp. TS-e1954]
MTEQSQGTEYTLQGVMRFLQIEWHSHERARNAWDIERAEMKAKIAKQEGDCRSAKKLNDLLDKQVRMLEKALKHERSKNKAITNGDPIPSEEEVSKEWNGKIGVRRDWRNSSKRPPDHPGDPEEETQPDQAESERESQRDRSKVFLQKCVEELTYLLTPPSHPPPPQVNPRLAQYPSEYANVDMQVTNPDLSFQHMQHQQQAQRAPAPPGVSHLPSLPNHYPPSARNAPEYLSSSTHQHPQQQQSPSMYRQTSLNRDRDHVPQPIPTSSSEDMSQASRGYQSRGGPEEEVERVTHSFDAYGRPIQGTEEMDRPRQQYVAEDTDGWNFEDPANYLETLPDGTLVRKADIDAFPNANTNPTVAATPNNTAKSPSRVGPGSHRRKSSGATAMARRRSDGSHEIRDLSATSQAAKSEAQQFKVRFALRGHLDVIRSVIFTGGGSPSEPEICTTGDDGMIKRWIIPANYSNNLTVNAANQNTPSQQQSPDLDIQSYFTHRGHDGMVTCLAASPAAPSFSTGGRATGDGWIFSGGQDATIRVWERGRVDPKATLEGHSDAVWTVCVLPSNGAIPYGSDDRSDSPTANSTLHARSNSTAASSDRILLASGSADHTIKIWSVSAPPHLSSPNHSAGATGSRRGVGGTRRHSVTSGSNFPSSPQPTSTVTGAPFFHTLIHSIEWPRGAAASPTCISPLGLDGANFVVSYADSSILIFDTRTGEEVVGMASSETYDGTPATGVNSVVVTSTSAGASEGGASPGFTSGTGEDNEEGRVHGATGSMKDGGVEGVVISGHEDRFVRFFDANSGQCTYSMLAHPSAISALSLSPDGRELVSAGHDASIRLWSLERRSCLQDITAHRPMRGEGVVCAVWSPDGRWIVGGGGDGVVKVFGR